MYFRSLVASQRHFFLRGSTQSIAFRKDALAALRASIVARQQDICNALHADLNKSPFESYMCEVGLVLDELTHMQRHLNRYMQPQKAKTPLSQFPARARLVPEPLGVCLVMSPWNYPFLLSLSPVIGAIAAGNCVILKPSAYAPNTSAILAELLEDAFPAQHVCVVEGGREENAALLEQKFDHIFFTGSVEVGKLVMEKAAQHLTPVTLELGGKSPCIVDETADLKLAARRIVFGKYLNAGQTCVAPDYLLVHECVKDELLNYIFAEIKSIYGKDAAVGDDFGKIITERHYRRLLGLLEGEDVVCGGAHNDQTMQIFPTVVDHVTADSPLMQEEIFGPILPVLTYFRLDEAIQFVQQRPKPLALYLFTAQTEVEDAILQACSFGGGCINDTIIHLACGTLPFGGVGESGMGQYHGKYSFDTFTHYKAVVKRGRLDLPVRYRPYTAQKESILRRLLK